MRHVGARASAGFTRPANSVLGIRLWPEHFTGQPLLPSQTFLWFDEKTGGMRYSLCALPVAVLQL
jgi:hypothetical protein